MGDISRLLRVEHWPELPALEVLSHHCRAVPGQEAREPSLSWKGNLNHCGRRSQSPGGLGIKAMAEGKGSKMGTEVTGDGCTCQVPKGTKQEDSGRNV